MEKTKAIRLAVLVVAIGLIGTTVLSTSRIPATIEMVTVAPGMHQYRVSGAFLKNGRPTSAPKIPVRFNKAFLIMKYQVSAADYSRCVSDGVCGRPFRRYEPDDNRPATGVSYLDTQDYIRWLSAETGVIWRLPTDIEWSYAAGTRFFDDAMETEAEGSPGPAENWLAKYKRTATADAIPGRIVKVRGAFGANENGIHDLAGNIWEWTSTCFTRTEITKTGGIGRIGTENCGVRVVEGRHRAYMTDFIQDAKSGGCSVGAPPNHLGFRLVAD